MLKQLAAVSMVAGLSAALVFGQRPGPMNMGRTPPDPQTMIQMRVNFLATLLSLSDAQKTKATAIFTDAYTSSQSIRSSMQSNRKSLSDAVKKNDSAAIDTLALAAGTLSGQLTAVESKAEAAFYAVLTPDQQAKYDTMPHRGFGGPGGRMGPAGFGTPRFRGSRAQ